MRNELDWQRLGVFICERREALGYATRRELKKASGLSYRILCDLENGKRAVSDGTLAIVEHALDWRAGSAGEILRGGEPTLLDQPPVLGTPDAEGWMGSATDGFRIAADITALGYRSIGSALFRVMTELSQVLASYLEPEEDELRGSGDPALQGYLDNSVPSVVGIALGHFAGNLREEQGISQEKAADLLGCPTVDIRLFEQGHSTFSKKELKELLRMYGISEQKILREFIQVADEASERHGWWTRHNDVLPDWLRSYLRLEQTAVQIRTFEAHFIPGLLQTAEYARAIICFPYALHRGDVTARVNKQVRLRMERQLLLERSNSPILWAVIDEAAITNAPVSSEVMSDQITHLIKMSRRERVIIQIVRPNNSALSGFSTSFSLLRFRGEELPDIVYTEQLTSALYLDRPTDIDEYRALLDLIAVEALSPTQSTDHLIALRNQLV